MAIPLTADQLREKVLGLLSEVAPEADPATIKTNVSLRDQLDIDSMDFLNFVIALHKTFQVEIPESDYPKLATVDKCVAYLSGQL